MQNFVFEHLKEDIAFIHKEKTAIEDTLKSLAYIFSHLATCYQFQCTNKAIFHKTRQSFSGFPLDKYRKIPIISPVLIFVQKAFLLGLFSRELIFGGAYY